MDKAESIRIAIVDDEPDVCEKVCRLLKNYPGFEVVGICHSGEDALLLIREKSPDLVILDVCMPGKDGFSVLQDLESHEAPNVIFMAADDQNVLRAFEFFPMGFLLKPIQKESFLKTLEHAKSQLIKTPTAEILDLLGRLKNNNQTIDRFTIRTPGKIFFLNVSDVDWIEAKGRNSLLHVGQQTHLLHESLANLEAKLSHKEFLRINRGVLVNSEHIAEIQPLFHGDHLVILQNGKSLMLSRRFRCRAERLFEHRFR
ncbi:MAG TPA: LytTR family DNA-binding domain-containing protein [Acidobacteriota bacterium]|nr:LytTR family DNA-binding domain-containing protein [Acidobacteriota bacterium]